MSNEVEKSYLESQIVLLTQERAALPARFEQLKAQQEARIEAFLQETGVLPRVKELRAEIDGLQRKVQSHSDVLGGKVEALQTVLDNFHRLKVPPGTEFDPVSGEPLSLRAAPTPAAPPPPAPKVEAYDPAASGSEVYADPNEGDEEDPEALEWGGGFAHEVAEAPEWPEEDDTDDDTADEGTDESADDESADDDIADAIENASDEAAVRALLNRYIRKV